MASIFFQFGREIFLIIAGLSLVYGMIANYKAYHSCRQIIWPLILESESLLDENRTIEDDGYRRANLQALENSIGSSYYGLVIHIAIPVIYLLVFIGSSIFMMLFADSALLGDIGNNTFIAIYFSTFAFYIKTYFSLFFSSKKENEITKKTCPRLGTILEYANKMEKLTSKK